MIENLGSSSGSYGMWGSLTTRWGCT